MAQWDFLQTFEIRNLLYIKDVIKFHLLQQSAEWQAKSLMESSLDNSGKIMVVRDDACCVQGYAMPNTNTSRVADANNKIYWVKENRKTRILKWLSERLENFLKAFPNLAHNYI